MPKITAVADAGVIEIRGVRQNNLKGFDLDLPLGKLIVVSGPSGSGKSSLAFDTVYAEGQRRYVETFCPYTRQFFERMDKPKVDAIRGIPPAIAIEQANQVKSTRSTVGTMTEINDYLKLLLPRVVQAFCPGCGREVRPETAQTIVNDLLAGHEGETFLVTFAIPVPAGTAPKDFFAFLQQQGYLRVWIGGAVHRADEPHLAPELADAGARDPGPHGGDGREPRAAVRGGGNGAAVRQREDHFHPGAGGGRGAAGMPVQHGLALRALRYRHRRRRRRDSSRSIIRWGHVRAAAALGAPSRSIWRGRFPTAASACTRDA